MADEPTTTTTTEPETPEAKTDVEKEAFLERLKGESTKRKEAEQRAQKTERELADIRQQLEEREQSGLPELEQLKKRLEQAEKRAQDAEKRAQDADSKVARTQKERWVMQHAAAQGFIDPDDAARYLDLDDIDSAEEAERAVKRVAKAKKHLIKGEDPKLPGRVLQNGQPAVPGQQKQPGIDTNAEAEMLASELKKLTQNWTTIG